MDDSSEIADVVGGELSSNGRQADAVSCRDEGGVDGVVGDARVLAVKLHWGPPKHMVRVVEQAGRGWCVRMVSRNNFELKRYLDLGGPGMMRAQPDGAGAVGWPPGN